MRTRTRPAVAVALALAAIAAVTAALPAAAGAKGIAALRVCGANGCHAVDPAAVREGFERFSDAPTPDAAEPFFTIRARARVSNGRLAEVLSFDWLPRAGVTRPYEARLWTRPDAVLAAALHRAAHGLRAKPAAELGSVDQAAPSARVVEVYAPAGEATRETGANHAPLAAAAFLMGIGALVLRRRRRARS